MKAHKLNMTRPELLELTMGKGYLGIEMPDMKRVLYDTNELCYAVYTALMEADIRKKDIVSVSNDGESLALTMVSKSVAKDVKSRCDDRVVRYGRHYYQVKIKVRDRHVIAEVECINDDTEDLDDSDEDEE